MRFYRNLGPICFAGETNAFQVFSAQPSTYLFQPKQPAQELAYYQQIATFYNSYLGNNNFQAYQENDKHVSLVMKNSKRYKMSPMDCNNLCSWMLEATKIVRLIGEMKVGLYGDFSTLQLYTVGNRKVFLYIPVYAASPQEKQIKQIEGLAKLANNMPFQKDMSQQLLVNKLAKCKSLQDITEELNYFYNIYEFEVYKKYDKIMRFQQSLVLKKPNKTEKSKRKLNLFQLQIKKSKPTFYSYQENSYVSYQPRKSTQAIHISMPYQKKTTTSLHTSSQRQMRPFSGRKSLKNDVSVVSLKNSKLKESIERKENDRDKVLKRIVNRSICEDSAVNRKDEQKLLRRLQNRKRGEGKIDEIDLAKSMEIQKNNVDASQVKNESIKNESTRNMISVDLPTIPLQNQVKQIQIIQQKSKIEEKQLKKQKEEKNIMSKQCMKQFIRDTNKYQSPRPSKQKQATINKLNTPLNSCKNTPKNQQPLPPPSLMQSQTGSKIAGDPEKKLKKKKIPAKCEQVASDQLQVIELDVKTKPAKVQKVQEDLLVKKDSFNQTRKYSIKSPLSQQCQQTKRVFQKQPTVQEKLKEKLKTTDLMGVAVAKTIGHLTNYEKIFWELPMFFIYRAFYLFRVEIIDQLQQLPYGSTPIEQLKEQNVKICESVTKLIKIVIKKMKKGDPNLLVSVKEYLTLEQRVDCSEPMRLFLSQYILSLQEAINSKYSELTLHLLEIVDAYLIYFGESIDFSARSKAQSSYEQMNVYLEKQLTTIKNYF